MPVLEEATKNGKNQKLLQIKYVHCAVETLLLENLDTVNSMVAGNFSKV